ncbi:methyltransferase domain-containing protein [Antribacter sp. KLBMP9083]|uniref:Methyltransferase domain-containing protein n=1 Tax=Antribacter soli TaxID=2910976 RepID=A0AA41U664_9MICO|nr:methyltransferase domain-containing protein [Antribacter soli]MCF4120733.1 methyltransferase domain-containing protein [Antribacter soli]
MNSASARKHEDPTARQRRVWDKAAPTYDKQMTWFERTQLGDGREWLGARARGRVLEVAIGTGRSLPHYPGDVTITGIELSPEMLARARRTAADLGRTADLREGDAEHLPFPDASFDTVVCSLALCSIPDPAAAVAEMRRVLVPGGRLLLLDHVASTWPPVLAVQWLVEQVTGRLAGEYFTRRQLPLVTAAGFEVVESQRFRAGAVERLHAVKPA